MKPTFSNLEVLQFAISMEESGIVFYEEHAKKAKGEVKELFLKLADDERNHAAYFQDLYDASKKESGAFEYMFDENVTSFFNDYAKAEGFSRDVTKIVTTQDAIAEGIATEAITIAYYEDILKYAKGETANTLKKLIIEEERHLEKLKNLRVE